MEIMKRSDMRPLSLTLKPGILPFGQILAGIKKRPSQRMISRCLLDSVQSTAAKSRFPKRKCHTVRTCPLQAMTYQAFSAALSLKSISTRVARHSFGCSLPARNMSFTSRPLARGSILSSMLCGKTKCVPCS